MKPIDAFSEIAGYIRPRSIVGRLSTLVSMVFNAESVEITPIRLPQKFGRRYIGIVRKSMGPWGANTSG